VPTDEKKPAKPPAKPAAKPRAKRKDGREDLTASTEAVNMLVKRSGCTIREAGLALAGRSLEQQDRIARSGGIEAVDGDYRQINLRRGAQDEALKDALAKLKSAGIDPAAPCPFGAPKSGTVPTYGDVVARMIYGGRASQVDQLVARAAA
jgi:hypothetical protein